MFKALQDEHAAKQTRLKEEVGASLALDASTPRVMHAPQTPRGPRRVAHPSFVRSRHRRLTPPLSPPPRFPELSRRSAMDAVSGLTEALVDTVNSGVVDVFENQKRIEEEARALKVKSAKFASVTSEWVRIVQGFDAELREIGDFEGWIKAMEFDLNNLTGMMEDVAKQGAAPPAGTEGDER